MTTWHGYTGKILDVDLTSAILSKAELDPCLANDYMGGKGFGAKILYDQLPPRCEPLSADNILVFATGPLTGTLAPSSGRFEVCTKSPATGLWLDSNCGGYFGPELKFAGYDMIIVRGKAQAPLMLVIDDDKFELRPAADLWGADTITTHRQIKTTFGKDFKVSCIGPAGENSVLIAGIISEYRALGRGGAGAVMGSKNLKAIAVRGSGNIPIFDPNGFMKTCREAFNELANNPDTGGGRQKYGTNVILSLMDEVGIHPVRNFQKGKFAGADRVNEDVVEEYYVRNKACFGCPIYCSKIAEVKEGKYKGSFTEGPEYENVWSFGANCENVDVGAIIQAEAVFFIPRSDAKGPLLHGLPSQCQTRTTCCRQAPARFEGQCFGHAPVDEQHRKNIVFIAEPPESAQARAYRQSVTKAIAGTGNQTVFPSLVQADVIFRRITKYRQTEQRPAVVSQVSQRYSELQRTDVLPG